MLIGVCLVASLSPGPAVLSTVETSLRYGARRATWHTLGLAAGEMPQSLLALAIAVPVIVQATGLTVEQAPWLATVLLVAGWMFIKRGNVRGHRAAMAAAFVTSAVFLDRKSVV